MSLEPRFGGLNSSLLSVNNGTYSHRKVVVKILVILNAVNQ